MNSNLALVELKKTVDPLPAAFHEKGAHKYLGMNRLDFRALVFAGIIPYTTHLNATARIYLREDLDAYLQSLPRSRMPLRECSRPAPAKKGVGR